MTGDDVDRGGALRRLTDIFYEQEVMFLDADPRFVTVTQQDEYSLAIDATARGRKRLAELREQVGDVVFDYDLSLAEQRPLFTEARRAARLRIRLENPGSLQDSGTTRVQ